ncbi:MAG TPA: cobaltochelatase subunit CobN [Patescibacteria group bacterium]|nr:cobaltochelatase subunit CobN [Patescibacteria group bacterium]
MRRIVFASNIDRQYTMMKTAGRELRQEGQLSAEVRSYLCHDSTDWNDEWQGRLTTSDLVVFYWMGLAEETGFVKKAAEFLQVQRIAYCHLPIDAAAAGSGQGISQENRETIRAYLTYGGKENFRDLWLWLNGNYQQGLPPQQAPRPLLWNGIVHPGNPHAFTEKEAYWRRYCQSGRPTIGILFPRDEWVWSDMDYQNELIRAIEARGMNAVAVFSHWTRNEALEAPGVEEAVNRYFYTAGQPVIDVLINTMKFSLTVGRPVTPEFLKRLDRPILQAYVLLQSFGEWEERAEGLTPVELSSCIVMPEFDGVIHSVPIAGKVRRQDGMTRNEALPERIGRLADKAKKWADLRRKSNHDKKIAIVFHNYPPSNSNIGTAQGMDSPASVRKLLQRLAALDYQVDRIPTDAQSLMNELLETATNDRRYLTDERWRQAEGKLDAEAYQRWFQQLKPQIREEMIRDWGEPPGAVFYDDGQLLIPGKINGNLFVTVQPPRGFGDDPGKIYHSPDCAPTHHYLAYYHWIRDVFKADAVLHIGTHGSLEWLPGKGSGLSENCYPDIALGELPNIYPYLITVVGEGLQAKRRSAACVIGHLPPPMSHAGVYDQLADLEKLLDEYDHFKKNRLDNLETIRRLIVEKAAEADLEAAPDGDEFDSYAQRLHGCINDLKNMQIRTGLHVLGEAPRGEEQIEYLLALTRMESAESPSLPVTVANICGYDYETLLAGTAMLAETEKHTSGVLLDEIREQCRQFAVWIIQSREADAGCREWPTWTWLMKADGSAKERLQVIADYGRSVLLPNLDKTSREMESILSALAGKFIEPGPAGAPTSGMPDILPTGRNFYGVDPRGLPSRAAWELGKTLGDAVIERYIAEEGRYPENIGMIFWSGCNMRTHGQCIAEFLYLLGVRPLWQAGSQRVTGLEVIPAAELGRPRIDVTARVSGMFRDALPIVLKLMDKAVSLVAVLEEEPEVNYVRKHVLADAAELTSSGVECASAWEQACYRIFGCPPGSYGAGVSKALEAQNWDSVDDLAKIYVRWGSYAYGVKAAGVFLPELFSRRLGSLDITLKNEDNREVHMLNSDDFNAYHGGMIAAVRSLKGESPRSYCGDSSNRQNAVVRSLDEEIQRLFRGEVMNPKYIEGMKKHGYKGAADLASAVAHCYDWDATSEVMKDWMYQGLAQKYALNEEMQQWMQEVNPWALQRIAEKLLEASQRGLWQADETTRRQLQQLYLDIEGELEERGEG